MRERFPSAETQEGLWLACFCNFSDCILLPSLSKEYTELNILSIYIYIDTLLKITGNHVNIFVSAVKKETKEVLMLRNAAE